MRRLFFTLLAAPALLPFLVYQPLSVSAADAASHQTRDLCFVATSDAHYDAFENEDRNDRVRDTLRAINGVTNIVWPEELGLQPIANPQGVVLLGDVIDDGDRVWQGKLQTQRQFLLFAADFGLTGKEGILNFRVYETWGNHDGPPVGAEKFGFSFQARLRERNLQRQEYGWLANLSTNALHYSWDWQGVHFVMLGIYPADEQNPLVPRYNPTWHNPQGALAFLRSDLEKNVGKSGRPVILMSHCGFDTDWWHTNDWRAVYDAAKPYKVAAYLYGHSGTGLRTWAPPGADLKWQCINTGQTENGFFVIRVTDNDLYAAYRIKRWQTEKLADGKTKRTWDGTWEWKHPLQMKLPAPDA